MCGIDVNQMGNFSIRQTIAEIDLSLCGCVLWNIVFLMHAMLSTKSLASTVHRVGELFFVCVTIDKMNRINSYVLCEIIHGGCPSKLTLLLFSNILCLPLGTVLVGIIKKKTPFLFNNLQYKLGWEASL